MKKPLIGARKPVNLSEQELVREEPLAPGRPLPLVLRPAVPGVSLAEWLARSREHVQERLLRHGGLLFRGFDIHSEQELERLIQAASGELLEYNFGSTPRTRLSGRIYTSTEYPAEQTIPLHNEMSYSTAWPLKIWFLSLVTARQGGETPIADSRRVLARLPPEVRERFEQRQVQYMRNYGHGMDVPWQRAFQTEDRSEVERICREVGCELEWLGGDRLRTRHRCQAVATHPKTGEEVWFNQAHLFHISSLPQDMRQLLLSQFAEDELPRNTYYGDGTPLEESALAAIRAAYEQEAILFPWEKGDVLLLDNMLVAHGRSPFVGPRKVVVGMAESWSSLS